MNQILVVVIFMALGVTGDSEEPGCSMRDVMTCVIQLKSYNVPIDTNMMNVVFNVSTEAKLVHVCRAYNDVMPCFQQRLATCANEKQRIRLAEVNRLLLFICAPFSLQRQKTLLKVGKCIGQVLNRPVTPTCPTKNHRFGHKLMLCRENCEANDVICLMRVRMSELAVCSVIAIEKQCGREAADFYSYMQTAIIGEEFPIQCKYDFAAGKIREILNPKEYESVEITTTESSHFTVQELVLPTAPTPKSIELNSIEDIPLLLTKNGKFVPNPELTKKALQFFQTERRKATSKNKYDEEEEEESRESNKKKIVRTRNYSRLFKSSKFAEVNLNNRKQPENTVIVKLVPSENPKNANKTSLESTEENISGFLTGARPIPDGSISKPIISPKSEINDHQPRVQGNSVVEKFGENFKDSVPTLTAARESYTPKLEFPRPSMTSFPTTTLSTTTSTKSTTLITTTTAPMPVTSAHQWPSTMMIMLPGSTAKPPVPSTVDKFLPWYYNTFTTKNDPLVTANPVFPYFNPESLPKNTEAVDPYYTQGHQNFDSNQFAAHFVSNINQPLPPSLPITAAPPSQRISEELSSLLDYSTFKEKADAFLTTAIDVLKPREKVQKPFSDHQAFYMAPQMVPLPSPNHTSQHPVNRTASGALSELMDTIERISPTVIDNIREKLDSLGHN